MEISDRRYQELLESIGIRHGGRDYARLLDRTEGKTARIQAPSMTTQVDLPESRTSVAREVKEILLVDPDSDRLLATENALRLVADVSKCSDFRTARARLLARPPDLLVTNLRLQVYNGLHLVHLTEGTRTRCIVYAIYDDRFLAQEAQTAGAFYEHPEQLPRVLASYVHAVLPPHDRRDPGVLDRRFAFRGGRRSSEL
jgi:hypothetical protein